MRKHLRIRRRLVVLGVTAVIGAAAASLAAGAFDSGGTPSIFTLEINGVTVQSASYQIDGTTVPPKRAPTQSYTVRITAPVSNDTTLLQDFRAGQVPGDVVITLFDVQAQEVVRYDFANAAAVSYQETGDRTSGTFEQDLVFTSSSLTVS